MASFLFREASLEYHEARPSEFHLGVPPDLEPLCGSDEATRCCAVVVRRRFRRHLHTIGLVRFTAEQSNLKDREDGVIIDQISQSCMSYIAHSLANSKVEAREPILSVAR